MSEAKMKEQLLANGCMTVKDFWLYTFAAASLQGHRANAEFGDMHENDIVPLCFNDAEALLAELEKRSK